MALAGHYRVEASSKSPLIDLDPSKGELRIAGCSIPENAERTYGPLMDALEAYVLSPASRTTVVVELDYFNSSTAKYLLDLLKLLEDAHELGRTKVQLEWRHAASDLDMIEAGKDYRDLLEFPVKLVESGI